MKTWIISICLALVLVISYVFVKPLIHSSNNKVSIVMTGQSSMKLWFKHWNWPYPLRIKTTYRNWPIKYEEFSRGGVYLKYHQLTPPLKQSDDKGFGTLMLKDFAQAIDGIKPDVAFFKFCFIDFNVNSENSDKRYNHLIQTVEGAYKQTNQRGVKLIVGNALPMTDSNDETVKLQKKYNQWLNDFSENKNDVFVFDMFNPLVDANGRMKPEFERGGGDPHLNDRAYYVLDETFFSKAKNWFKEGD